MDQRANRRRQVPELTQQAGRAERLADAGLDGLHMREHEDAGVVHQRLRHVEERASIRVARLSVHGMMLAR